MARTVETRFYKWLNVEFYRPLSRRVETLPFIPLESEIDSLIGGLGPKKELARRALVYCYRAKDGLRGDEGAFLLCGFWLVVCLARLGEINEAQRNFNELVGHANHLGLYSEEVDPASGETLGNLPQAFSHVGFIMMAKELDEALNRTASQGIVTDRTS